MRPPGIVRRRRWNGAQAYANSKLFDVMIAFAVARYWPHVLSNAFEPGWVATKMGALAQGTTWSNVSKYPGDRCE